MQTNVIPKRNEYIFQSNKDEFNSILDKNNSWSPHEEQAERCSINQTEDSHMKHEPSSNDRATDNDKMQIVVPLNKCLNAQSFYPVSQNTDVCSESMNSNDASTYQIQNKVSGLDLNAKSFQPKYLGKRKYMNDHNGNCSQMPQPIFKITHHPRPDEVS